MKLRRALSTLALVFVMFFNVSGGAFTTETLIVSVGPGLGLLLLTRPDPAPRGSNRR